MAATAVAASALLIVPLVACTTSSDAGEAPSWSTVTAPVAETPTSGGSGDRRESSSSTGTTDAHEEPGLDEADTQSPRERATTDMTPWTVTHDLGPSRNADDAQPVTTTTWGFQTEPTPGGGRTSVDAG